MSRVTGAEPKRISGSPSRASSEATTRSQAIASSRPPARAKPWTWAMTGFEQRQIASVAATSSARIVRQPQTSSGASSDRS